MGKALSMRSATGQINWAILLSFLFTTFSGAARKWFISSGAFGNVVLLVQLVMPWLLFAVLFLPKKKMAAPGLMASYLIYLIIAAANVLNKTLYHGILGIVLHGGFFILLFTYLANRDKVQLGPLLQVFTLVAVLEVVLGVIQYQLPPIHFLNKYATDQVQTIAVVDGRVRITGTFSYIGGYGAFVIFMAMLAWAYPLLTQKVNAFFYLLPGMSLIAAIMNGGRGPTALVIMFLILGQVFSPHRARSLRLFLAALVLGGAVIAFSPRVQDFVVNTYESFMTRVRANQASGEQTRRILGPIEEVIYFRGQYPVFGVGLGATYQGANAVWGESYYARQYGGYEEEMERVIIEGGFLLFFFKLILLAVFAFHWSVPWIPKIILLALTVLFIPIVFNIYQVYYMALGFILLDQAYLTPTQTKD